MFRLSEIDSRSHRYYLPNATAIGKSILCEVAIAADLDKFLGQLPKGWPLGVEMRNRNWLKPEYSERLVRHQVAHVYNSWDAMPPVGEQMALPGSRTNPDLVAARLLLKPGRKYEQAVKAFEPYDSIKEENPEARAAGRALIAEGQAADGRRLALARHGSPWL